jgi:hypothetical protein
VFLLTLHKVAFKCLIDHQSWYLFDPLKHDFHSFILLFRGNHDKLKVNYVPTSSENFTLGIFGLDFVDHPFLYEFYLDPEVIYLLVKHFKSSLVLGYVETLNNGLFAFPMEAVSIPIHVQSRPYEGQSAPDVHILVYIYLSISPKLPIPQPP